MLYDGAVIPALSVGAGAEARWIGWQTGGAIAGDDMELTHFDVLPTVYSPLSIGLPIHRGFVVVEPFLRLERTIGDDRSHTRSGLDVTFAAF